MRALYILIALLLALTVLPVYAGDKPLPYTKDKPNIVRVKKHLIELQWRQEVKTLVVVYKLSETRKPFDSCGWLGDNYKAQYCKVIFSRRGLVGNMRIRDKDYRVGDEYYILEYKYLTHNGAYGPFEP